MYFDTHAHLDDECFKNDQEQVIERAKNAGISLIVNVGYNLISANNTVELTKKYDYIYGAVGMHPHHAIDADERTLSELKLMSKEPKIVAIGEIGLDYYYDNSPRDIQRLVFRKQIQLAKELKMPIIIHDRDAHQEVYDIVKEEKAEEVGGIFHCYSGSLEMAKEILKLGFYISFAGPVTFKNAHKLKEIAREIPLDRILIETDCPYLTPVPYRGKRNEPAYVLNTAKEIANIKGLSAEELAKITCDNGKRVFGIVK